MQFSISVIKVFVTTNFIPSYSTFSGVNSTSSITLSKSTVSSMSIGLDPSKIN